MSSKLLTAPEREGMTFNIAIRLLGAVAIAQIILVTWAVLLRFKGEEINPANSFRLSAGIPFLSPVDSTVPDDLTPLSDVYATPPTRISPPSTGDSLLPQDQMLLAQNTIPPYRASPSPPQNHLAHRISLPAVDELVSSALLLREQGDTQAALDALRQADTQLPSHPKILAELATTLHQMGLETKAATYWERVHQMRPEGAGAYWDLADMALKGQILEDASSLDTYLRISRHTARAVPAPDDAQHIILRLHLEVATPDNVSGDEMYLNVLFYDAVNGTTFEPTIADTKPNYISAPYDWALGADEIIEIEYFLPKLAPEQLATLGHRRFFGYVVELYYKDLLQDIVASPRKLARLGSSASRAARPIIQSLPQP